MNGFLAIAQWESASTCYDKTPMRLFPTFAEAEQWVEDFDPTEFDLRGTGEPDWFEIIEFTNGRQVVNHDEGLMPSRKGRDPKTRAVLIEMLRRECRAIDGVIRGQHSRNCRANSQQALAEIKQEFERVFPSTPFPWSDEAIEQAWDEYRYARESGVGEGTVSHSQ